MTRLMIMVCSLVLAACTGPEEDIGAWMAEQTRGMRGSVKPLPEIKPFPIIEYDAGSLASPFASSRIEPETRAAATAGGPDLTRPKEPLELYPLESLTMVGALIQGDTAHALIRVDRSLHQVRVGNYLGQNYGVVTQIAETEVTLMELVEDISGDWVERTAKLLLQEQ